MSRSHRHGYSLIEVLVVIAMIGILMGLLLSAVQQIRETASHAQCANKMRQLGLATQQCHDAFGVLPPLAVQSPDPLFGNQSQSPIKLPGPFQGIRGVTVFYFLLPFLEEDQLYKQWYPFPRQAIGGVTLDQIPIQAYQCPSEPSSTRNNGGFALVTNQFADVNWAPGNYAANYLVFGDPLRGSTEGAARIPSSFPDGTSNVIVFAERYANCVSNGNLSQGAANLWNDANPYWRPQICNPFPAQPSTTDPNPPTLGYPPCPRFEDRPDWLSGCHWPLAQNPHPKGMNVCLGDGSVRAIARSISAATWAQACDPRDGVRLGSDW